MRTATLLMLSLFAASSMYAGKVAESQLSFIERYEKQTQKVAPEDALINTDPEPDISDSRYENLFDGKTLNGWTPRGGFCNFEVVDGEIVGTVAEGSPSTYLSTDREDYADFIFTAELYWEVDGNSGVMIRAQRKPGKGEYETVFGPQVEMEGFPDRVPTRNWSGGIYGQGAGGWRYPLWLEAHEDARNALKEGEWNRVTVLAQGKNIKTWINGVPAAHWLDEEYGKGYIGLQVHSGKQGQIRFRNIKLLELTQK